jgi:hypothetical protein
MKVLVVTLIAGVVLLGAAAANGAPAAPRTTTLFLDDFTLDPTVQYASDTFWCDFNNYGAVFSDYAGRCPYQDFTATLHWKKSPGATEYDVCLEPVFSSYTPGFACYVMPAAKSGSPTAQSMSFDSASMDLNAFQGTTQVWVVHACSGTGLTQTCSDSNPVFAAIPWTG